jgi:hypothetical protein
MKTKFVAMPHQTRMIKAFIAALELGEWREILAITAVGVGKTSAMLITMLIYVEHVRKKYGRLIPGLLIGATWGTVRTTIFQLQDFARKIGLEGVVSDLTLKQKVGFVFFVDKCMFIVRSMERPDQITGFEVGVTWGDEISDGQEKAYKLVWGRMRQTDTRFVFATSNPPRKQRWLIDYLREPKEKVLLIGGKEAIKTSENKYLPVGYSDDLDVMYGVGSVFHQREAQGLFVEFVGNVLNPNVIDYEYDPASPYELFFDFGSRRMAAGASQIRFVDGKWVDYTFAAVLLDGDKLQSMPWIQNSKSEGCLTGAACLAIKEIMQKHFNVNAEPAYIYYDPTGGNKTSSSITTDVDVLGRNFPTSKLRHTWKDEFRSIECGIKKAVALTIQHRLYFSSRLNQKFFPEYEYMSGLDAIRNARYDDRPEAGKMPTAYVHDDCSHFFDAKRYLLTNCEKLAVKEASK